MRSVTAARRGAGGGRSVVAGRKVYRVKLIVDKKLYHFMQYLYSAVAYAPIPAAIMVWWLSSLFYFIQRAEQLDSSLLFFLTMANVKGDPVRYFD